MYEKDAAKKDPKEYVESRQSGTFKDDLRTKSTLSELAKVADGNRRGLSPYLARVCPEGLRQLDSAMKPIMISCSMRNIDNRI